MDKERNRLNTEVTRAILLAEEADHAAATAWALVAEYEGAIANLLRSNPKYRLEYEIALDGVRFARAKEKTRRDHV